MIFNLGMICIKLGVIFDFEIQDSYNLMVIFFDGLLSDFKFVFISVLDKNDVLMLLSFFYFMSVFEDVLVGMGVYDVDVSDQDGDLLMYLLLGLGVMYFMIDFVMGIVIIIQKLNYEDMILYFMIGGLICY